MIARVFEHRSGRIIALCRSVLALIFFLALWIDPAQPVRSSELGYALLGSYLVFAALMLAVALNSWWWDHRLSWTALLVDIFAFLAAVYFTEGVADDFTSPFLAFFAFLMLAATIRWNWRITALVGLVATGLYLSIGLGLAFAEIDFDQMRFGRRVAYMLVLALILIWFGLQRSEQHVDRFRETPGEPDKLLPPLDDALAYAIHQCGARAGAIAWEQHDEPNVELRTVGIQSPGRRLGPQYYTSENNLPARVRLCSADRNRRLLAVGADRPAAVGGQCAEPLADLLGIGEALCLPFAGTTGRGELVLSGIPGVCADHVALGAIVAREVAAGFDRHSAMVLTRESALARTRDGLARDLHDSIAQSLAGATLRMEGLRKWIRDGHDPDPEISQIKEALRAEQLQVRAMIDRLRAASSPVGNIDLAVQVGRLVKDLAPHWGIDIDFSSPGPIVVPASLAHEVQHMVREAVANGVRHGRAENIVVTLDRQAGGIRITVSDDGTGFAQTSGPDAPRSIRERLGRIDGTLGVQTGVEGTVLVIAIPQGE